MTRELREAPGKTNTTADARDAVLEKVSPAFIYLSDAPRGRGVSWREGVGVDKERKCFFVSAFISSSLSQTSLDEGFSSLQRSDRFCTFVLLRLMRSFLIN